MQRVQRIILEGLYGDTDSIGVIEFAVDEIPPQDVDEYVDKLKERLKTIGVQYAHYYPKTSKFTVTTVKSKAQAAREMAEQYGMLWLSELFDTEDEEVSKGDAEVPSATDMSPHNPMSNNTTVMW